MKFSINLLSMLFTTFLLMIKMELCMNLTSTTECINLEWIFVWLNEEMKMYAAISM